MEEQHTKYTYNGQRSGRLNYNNFSTIKKEKRKTKMKRLGNYGLELSKGFTVSPRIEIIDKRGKMLKFISYRNSNVGCGFGKGVKG